MKEKTPQLLFIGDAQSLTARLDGAGRDPLFIHGKKEGRDDTYYGKARPREKAEDAGKDLTGGERYTRRGEGGG